MSLYSGYPTKYDEGSFLFKFLPPVERAQEHEVSARVTASKSAPRRDGRGRLPDQEGVSSWLSRHAVPPGEPPWCREWHL